ncbi:probable G-protein coupled receptor No9 [Folsomia candida]|uniref:Octopamine receptor 1 n=1 Tax=Folsomia candida TaxID=158441 RepID=A0A226DLA6_FOLCA|nr:probable G-protein coupled receptor No9 [Folsomia candida]XP_035713420.1 probable G-protein coupled receptor No9 [Folsomia candida]OXA45778.1 Octopamine receptor 1 [Folsomia candida]
MKTDEVNVNYLNVSCDEIFDVVKWKDAKVLISLVILAFINVAVIVGNCLVIAAVFISTKLRTVTNLFIVSLAVADLMVGIAVLPFSATWEIFEIWIFGEVWCSVWLAVDVWLCTASILNLCAISLDRYVAVTRPVTYPSIMSSSKAKLLIGCVWVLSFLICFPPLVGWNDRKRTYFRQLANLTTTLPTFDSTVDEADSGADMDSSSNWILSDNNEPSSTPAEPESMYYEEECTYTCELTNDKGYVLYSAFGSFFLPMFVMLFFYWRIYKAAVETTRAINQGFRTTKGSRLLGTRFEEQRLTLRIHRGTSRSAQHHHHHHHHCPSSPKPMISSPSNGRQQQQQQQQQQLHNNGGTPGGNNGNGNAGGGGSASSSSALSRIPRSRSHERLKVHLTPPPRGSSKRSASYRARTGNNPPGPSGGSTSSSANGGLRPCPTCQMGGGGSRREKKLSERRQRRQSADSDSTTPSPSPTLGGVTKYEILSSSSAEDGTKPKLISRMGKRNIKAQVKRFKMETKAAKTLGIIVGGFIGCWCPFFTIYVIRAFCATCIPPLLFSVLFWLGYCNSAINPCIYALFSKDFRFAFKKILCRCFLCQREKKPQPQVVPIFLSSLGDSEGNNEPEQDGSDSR